MNEEQRKNRNVFMATKQKKSFEIQYFFTKLFDDSWHLVQK